MIAIELKKYMLFAGPKLDFSFNHTLKIDEKSKELDPFSLHLTVGGGYKIFDWLFIETRGIVRIAGLNQAVTINSINVDFSRFEGRLGFGIIF